MATTKTEKADKREYTLRSSNKFLTVGSMGVQFYKGFYKTTDPAEVKALITIDGVELEEN